MVRDAQETRQRLLKAAIAEFSAYGIAGARIDRIAANAPANKALIYAYFGNKEQLFDAAFAKLADRTVDEVPFDPDDLPTYAGRLFDRFWRFPEAVRMSAWHRLERGEEQAIPSSVVRTHRDKITKLTEAQKDGRIPDRIPPAGLLSLILVIATMWTDVNPDFASVRFSATKKARRRVVIEAVRQLVRA